MDEIAEIDEIFRDVLPHYGGWEGVSVTRIGSGLINRSYLVVRDDGELTVLQAVNPIFPPEMHGNIAAVTERLAAAGLVTPRLLPTRDGQPYLTTDGGGVAIFAGDKPAVSRNFVSSRVLANGPLRVMFELGYAPFDAGANVKVSETKRITLDAGRNFNRVASTFKVEGGGAGKLDVGVGIGKHANADLKTDKLWMRTWEKVKDDDSSLGCAVVLPAGTTATVRPTDLDTFIVAKASAGVPFVYYMGAEWSKRPGGASDAGGWTRALQEQARDIASPVKVTLAKK